MNVELYKPESKSMPFEEPVPASRRNRQVGLRKEGSIVRWD
jgi:hypothetical protein